MEIDDGKNPAAAMPSNAPEAPKPARNPAPAPAPNGLVPPATASRPAAYPAYPLSQMNPMPFHVHNNIGVPMTTAMGQQVPVPHPARAGKIPHPLAKVTVHTAEPISTLISSTKAPGIDKKPPPPSTGGGKKSGRRRFTPKSRSDQSVDKKKAGASFTIFDEEPRRLVNPLCDIPRFDGQQHEHPSAPELYVWSDLIFGKPDTYPLSYYARLLGFQVEPAPEDKYVVLDPTSIPLIKNVPHIPPLGSLEKMWNDEDMLQYKDPVYTALSQETSGIVSSLNKATLNLAMSRFLSPLCLDLAKELMGQNLPEFKIDDRGGDFGITCGDYSIRYDFVWYQFSKEHKSKQDTAKIGPYGVTSLASRIQKPKVSELTVYIKWMGKGEPPTPPPDETHTSDAPSPADKNMSTSQPSGKKQSTPATSDPSTMQPVTMSEPCTTNEEKEKDEGKDSGGEPRQTATGAATTTDRVLIVLAALCLEHARACDIFYGLAQVSEPTAATLLSKYFRMVPLKNNNNNETTTTLLCDLNKCSSKYAFLLYKTPPQEKQENGQDKNNPCDLRMLVRLPPVETVKSAIDGTGPKRQKVNRRRADPTSVNSATESLRSLGFGIRLEDETIKFFDEEANYVTAEVEITNFEQSPNWNVLRSFSVHSTMRQQEESKSELLESLCRKRDELVSIECQMEPKLRSILNAVFDERLTYEKDETKRKEDQRTLKEYKAILNRRKEMDMAFQKQRDQDMDAVCEICNDGEVTPDNQILFCEACNVAIHQYCYGIEKVPEGDYYCIACRYFGRDKIDMAVAKQIERGASLKMAPSPLPINCELCPRKQGAFIRTDTSSHVANKDGVKVSKWVHVLCAKWQGLNFVDFDKKDCVEDVADLKLNFRVHGIICQLCQGDRGAFNQCRSPGCKNWLHVTCSRAYGRCEVIHGENCHGEIQHNPWTLSCPEHSNVVPPSDCFTLEQLVNWAKAFPPEPKVEKIKPKPPNKTFGKMSGKERREFLSVLDNEQSLVKELVTRRLHGVRCEVCHTVEEEGKNLTKCIGCAIVFCDSCKLPFDEDDQEAKQFKCQACKFVEEGQLKGEEVEPPKCILCFQPSGWLRKARGFPMKKWAYNRHKDYERTLFGKPLWVHALCAMWQHPTLVTDMTIKEVNLSNAIMTHGKGFILGMNRCELCGQKDGLKMKCSHPTCRQRGQKSKPSHFHVTCARQAGFEVETNQQGEDIGFHAHCYRHQSCEFAFRARLEDLIEFEKLRAGKKLDDAKSMSISHASRLVNSAIVVMNYLGWAWRWAEWWVESGSNWEPLLEPGQNEKNMTNEQLKIVESTPESRCEDARRCRLAAFGAAVRNRAYDDEEDGPTVMFDRALRAVLKTKSLVGPLTKMEIDFFVQWLGIAYRSKSRILGFGEDKIAVDEKSPSCLHEEDKSPKFVLGNRRLPGKQLLPEGIVFESDFTEIDDFLKPERLDDGTLYSETLKIKKMKQKPKKKANANGSDLKRGPGRPKTKHVDLEDPEEKKPILKQPRKVGRPPKNAPIEESQTVSESVTNKAAVVEQGESESSKRHRKAVYKSDFYLGESAIESVLATEGRPGKRSRKSAASEPVENVDEHATRARRKSVPTRFTNESTSGNATTNERNEEVPVKGSTRSVDKTLGKEEDVRSKKRPGRPSKKALVDLNDDGEIEASTESKDGSQTKLRRKPAPISYNEEDWADEVDDEIEDDDVEQPKSSRNSRTKNPYTIPRKGKKRVFEESREEEVTAEPDDPEDTMPISSLRIPRKKKAAAEEEDEKDDDPEPTPDLSSPQRRGRHRGKLEAARFVLPGTDRSLL